MNMTKPSWVTDLAHEDLEFIKRFLLASGSLKDIARDYGISYPTVRLRLDRVIEKIKASEQVPDADILTRKIKMSMADGSIDIGLGKQLLDIYEQSKKEALS